MTFSRPASARPLGAARIVLLLAMSACGLADGPTSLRSGGPSAARTADSTPSVRSTSPDSGFQSTTIDVRVLGSNFDQGSRAVWALHGDTALATTKVKVNSTRFVKSGELVANITIAADAQITRYDVEVVDSRGKPGIGIELFAIKPPPFTLYTVTMQGGLATDPAQPFAATGKTGDPFLSGVSGDEVYLALPSVAGGDAAVCNKGSTLEPSIASWYGYAGVWKGSFSIAQGGHTSSYSVHFNGTRADGSGGSLLLAINSTAVKSNNNLTLTFTNARGLVSLYSTPPGTTDADPRDRCLTFSVNAIP